MKRNLLTLPCFILFLYIPTLFISDPAVAQNAALHFDGAIGDYDYISVPDDPSLDLSGSLTLEAWINFDQVNVSTPGYGWRALFTKDRYFNAYGLMTYAPAGASHVVRFYHKGMTADFTDFEWTSIDPNTWYHLAVTYNEADAIIYLDGAEAARQAVTRSVDEKDDNLNIGYSATGIYPWDGLMDEVRVWNVARTEAEINDAKDAELTGSEPGLVLYYNLEEGNPAFSFPRLGAELEGNYN